MEYIKSSDLINKNVNNNVDYMYKMKKDFTIKHEDPKSKQLQNDDIVSNSNQKNEGMYIK